MRNDQQAEGASMHCSVRYGSSSMYGNSMCAETVVKFQRPMMQYDAMPLGGTEAAMVDMAAMAAPCMVATVAPCMAGWGQCMGLGLGHAEQ